MQLKKMRNRKVPRNENVIKNTANSVALQGQSGAVGCTLTQQFW